MQRTMRRVTAFAILAATASSVSIAHAQEPLGGQLAAGVKPSVNDLDGQVAYQRAFEATLWTMPALAIYRIRVTFHEVITGNQVTPYIAGASDLRDGRVVLEVPAKPKRPCFTAKSSMRGSQRLRVSGRLVPTKAEAENPPIADSNGQPVQAGKTYKLRVPKEMPAKQFWSLTMYDRATWAFVQNPLDRAGLGSFNKDQMKMNADGSVDLYVGPDAPPGLEANWIPTMGKEPYHWLRLYGPEEAFWSKSFKMPDLEPVN